ncbi:alpha-hydroxy acid oxidase [Novosphingobium panipatense]|uniref:4-hydroxymandelate oxidase n=1 Tax=Novosphingobium panipatense TaxID=428991 RepID=A0ABY1QPT3_9SPHN|nr:alpha-hydroxy acid oxidase [Novosphingobium panipatense]SMP75374.1 4-hydroxymandelate oxidase [Novosphingobium panipatense]
MMAPLPPLQSIPEDLRTLADYEARAKAHLTAEAWLHIQQGSGREITLRQNRGAFDRLGLLPRALVKLKGASTATDLLGRRHAAPLLLAPLAYQRIAHSEGELACVRAATALDTGMIVSTLASISLEEVAAAARSMAAELGKATAPLWFQLYLQPEREHSLQLVRRAEAAGYEAIVLTIDAALKPTGMTLPKGVSAVNLAGLPQARHTAAPGGQVLFGTPLADAAPGWDDLAWLRRNTRLPLLLKGLLLGADAARAVDEGVDGIILSNHGGRVLDGLPSALDMLPDVIDATRGEVPLLLDGGVRQGTDIIKALALGAQAVLVGRPQMHALAVAGLPGVAHMLQILRAELEAALGQLGCRTPGGLSPDWLIALNR